MYDRINKSPNQSFFLFGPRGTGKSTWIREHFQNAKVINLLDERLFQEYLINDGLLADELRTLEQQSWVVIDEVQRLPQLLNTVHLFMEESKLKFVLSGSSARKLKSSGVNLLAGRAILQNMFPFTPEELKNDFDLQNVLQYGSIPIVFTSLDKQATLESYVLTYLHEEIKSEALVRNLPGFTRFLPIASLFHGQELNVSSLARDAGVARTTVTGYIDILIDTLLVTKLEPFSSHLRVREKKHPKLYWIDPGLVRGIQKKWGIVNDSEKGSLLEGLVFMLLRAYNQKYRFYDDIYYWSPANTKQTEVDFLLKKNDEYLAIEIKAKSIYRTNELKGLRAIRELPRIQKRILVYLGDRQFRTEDNIDIIPFQIFLGLLEQNQLFKNSY